MENLQKSVVNSLDGRDVDLYPHLAYILQDLWEIGASPEEIIALIKKHNLHHNKQSKVLDLGCGKGAIAINLAKEFGFTIHGIDALAQFIDEANERAEQYHVNQLCQFEVGDIHRRIEQFHDYDLVILGAIGPVFGNMKETLKTIKKSIKQNGYIIIDDAYIPDGSKFRHAMYEKRSDVLTQIRDCQVEIIDECVMKLSGESEEAILSNIKTRIEELIIRHPDKREVFEGYIKAQGEEYDILEHKVKCVTWLFKKVD